MGTVYLIHFNRPYRHAQHYIGYTDDLGQRMAAHRAGNGARLLEVISDAGITWRLARTWEGDKALEKRLKAQHNAPRLCPICQAKAGKSPF
jgi:predicted GIY-YIG superfamily endonuclease